MATDILLLGMVAMLFSITQGVNGVRMNTMLMDARNAVTQQMETVRNMPFATIQALPATSSFIDTNGDGIGDGLEAIPGATGTIWACNYNPATGACGPAESANIRRVGITVWLGPGRTVRLVSIFSNV